MALLIISLILLTILVSMYLLSKNKEKQSDNIVDKPEIKTKTISSSQDKQEWAKRMAEIRKQKKRQREQELIEKEINQQKQYTQLEHSFKELGASIIWQEKLYHKNCYNIYAPEDIDLNKWFLLLEQSIQLSFLLIKDCYFVDNSANNLLKFRFDSIIRPTFDHTYVSFEDNGNEKYFSGKKKVQNFLFCYLETRKLKHVEMLWSKIIENGIAESNALSTAGEQIEDKVSNALKSSNYNSMFNPTLECVFDDGVLVIDYELPAISKYPAIKEYKYVSSTNEVSIKKQPENYILKEYEKALYSITLRTIYEAFYVDTKNEIKIITYNGHISSINPSTGLMERKCILSIQVPKEKYTQINLAQVDPKSCFKSFKGVSASKLINLTPITPILSFNKDDKRFVQERQVITHQGTNLASMHWEDFEQLVRELFELEFAQNGGEVKVTQASRDGGVDAVIFDPDPLRGGKIVIQAKRYTNTVGVSAVRDLYGTVINEGANTGILITTSDYGHDSYEFAKDKPLKLLNGGHLLALLLKNGRNAYINIEEAKKLYQMETES